MSDDVKLATLIDNEPEGDHTLLTALKQLLPLSKKWDIATGYFEVGALLKLDGLWQKLESIRLVMGDETTKRTRQLLVDALCRQVDESIEAQKEDDDTLQGLEAVRRALESKQLQVKVFTQRKFHAKAHRLTARTGPVNFGIVGSSNFTLPGLTENIELNLFTTAKEQLDALEHWFADVWRRAEEVNEEVLKVINRHLREFSPFEVWAKALYEYFAGREAPLTEWEEKHSVIFPLLSKYQQDGYRQARAIADRWGGAFLCDGVGLGKTFIGLMLLEYHIQRGDRILLIVPKSARESVWESALDRYLRPHYPVACEENLKIHNHTDFGREGTIPQQRLDYYRDYYRVILVDEAHHFRTPSANRSKMLRALCDGKADKRLYFLTATPINNTLRDLYHLINYVARDRLGYFKSLGIHNFSRHFAEAERRLEQVMQCRQSDDIQTAAQDADILRTDRLLKALVIQRSRAYVKDSERNSATAPAFPDREKPRVISYSLKKVYAELYADLKAAFDKDEPLLTLAVYNPEPFRKGERKEELVNRDKQVIGLIRTLLLKRLESSYKAFEASLEDLLRKMAAFVDKHDPQRWEKWKEQNAQLWQTIQQHQQERQAEEDADAEVEEGNEFDDVKVAELNGKPDDYDMDGLLTAIEADMTLLVHLLAKVYDHLSPEKDDKLQQLVCHLRNNPMLKNGKVVIFTEFRDTARYLWRQLRDRYGFTDVEELDSTRKVDRESVIKRFAPYYNCTADELPDYEKKQIRVLISTDVLSEGLNLQDANLIINYDLHWNPVRLMQRIGRVDRRLNPEIERRLGRDGSQPLKVYIFNFLPPDELDELLGLYRRVTGKLLRISKTLGIEAPILRPDDEFEALRLFNEQYEGQRSVEEQLHLELQRLRRQNPTLYEELSRFPRRVFSGRRAEEGGTRGLFCCYRFPPSKEGELGEVRWYFRVADTGKIWESDKLEDIARAIRSAPESPRVTQASADDLKTWRREIENECVKPHLRNLQAPMGAKEILLCWMEVC